MRRARCSENVMGTISSAVACLFLATAGAATVGVATVGEATVEEATVGEVTVASVDEPVASWLVATPGEEVGDDWRQDPLLGEALLTLVTAETARASVLFVPVSEDESLDPAAWSELLAASSDPLWLLQERPDLSYVAPSFDPDDESAASASTRIQLFTIATRRQPRFEKRLRERLALIRATGRSAIVVLEDADPSTGLDDQMRFAVIETTSVRPRVSPRALTRRASQNADFRGRLRATTERSPAGLLGSLLVREAPSDPLPTSSHERTSADVATVGADIEPTAPLEPGRLGETPEDNTTVAQPVSRSDPAVEPLSPIPAPPRIESADEPDPMLSERATITAAVTRWAGDWAAQRVDDYLSAYSVTFQPTAGSRALWHRERREKLLRPEWIEVTVSELAIEALENKTARVLFNQEYRSDRYTDRVRKQIDLAREDGHWRITREAVLQVLEEPDLEHP